MYITMYRDNVRLRSAIIARQHKINNAKKAVRHEHIKNNILIVILVICIIGMAWIDGSY